MSVFQLMVASVLAAPQSEPLVSTEDAVAVPAVDRADSAPGPAPGWPNSVAWRGAQPSASDALVSRGVTKGGATGAMAPSGGYYIFRCSKIYFYFAKLGPSRKTVGQIR